MSWKHFAYLTLLIAALTAVKFFMGETARWLALLGLFGLGYIATLVARWDPDERWYTLALSLGFTASIGYQRVAWDRELTTIHVTSVGIEQRLANGTVVALPWSEVKGLRNRTLLMCNDIYGFDGRRVRVGYTLDGFARLIELTREQSGHE